MLDRLKTDSRFQHAATLLVFLLLAALQTWPLPARLFDGLITLPHDGIPNTDISIFLWNFWWVKKALLDLHQNPAFCDWLCRPGDPAFVFPTLSLQNCLVALPMLSVCSLETTYNILIWAILALTGWSAYLLAHDMTRSWPAALLAGLVFGTVPLQLRVAGQLNVFTLFWMPLALLAGRRWLANRRASAAIALALYCLLNMLAEWHHAVELTLLAALWALARIRQTRSEAVRRIEKKYRWFLAAILVVYVVGGQFLLHFHAFFFISVFVYFVAVLLGSRESQAMQRLVARLTGGAAIAALALFPIAFPMYRAMQQQPWLRDTPLVAKAVFAADFAGYLMPGPWVERLFPNSLPPEYEMYGTRTTGASDVFPGFVAWLLFATATIYWMRRGRRGGEWLALAAVFLVVSLGPLLKFGGIVHWKLNAAEHVILPAMAFDFLAVLQAIRVFLRFAFIAWLCLAIFSAVQAADWLAATSDRPARRKRELALLALAGLMVVERLDLPQPVGRIPEAPALQWLHNQPSGTVLMIPLVFNQWANLYAQTQHGHPMVNPYVSRRPQDIAEFTETNALLQFLSKVAAIEVGPRSVDEAHRLQTGWLQLNARWLVVDRSTYQPRTAERIHQFTQDVLHLRIAWSDDGHVVYE